jgi:hypothetical protein
MLYNYRGSFVELLAPEWWGMSSVLEFEKESMGARNRGIKYWPPKNF